MRRSPARSLVLLVVSAALAIACAAPAQAYTPPIGSDKGSITATTPTTDHERFVAPEPNGIIAILIG